MRNVVGSHQNKDQSTKRIKYYVDWERKKNAEATRFIIGKRVRHGVWMCVWVWC